MKWPALYGRQSGELEITGQTVRFQSENGMDIEIQIRELMIETGGTNSNLYYLRDRYQPSLSITVQDPAPIKILARKGVANAGSAVGKARWKLSFRFLRWVLPVAVVLAVFFLLPYVLSALPSSWMDVLVPPQYERVAGIKIFELYKPSLHVSENHPVQPKLQAIVDHLVERNPQLKAHSPKIYFSSSEAVNAFALAGGIIVCNRGLIQKAGSINEVIGVIGHELGHVEERHVTRSLVSSLGIAGAYLVLSVFTGSDLATLLGQASNLLGLKYSRTQEASADDRGFEYLVRSKISPLGMRDFFKRLHDESRSTAAIEKHLSFLSSHPVHEERLYRIAYRLGQLKGFEPEAAPVSLAELKVLADQ
ncbi:MAG TPA: M48 family metallopeptidase [Bdellovibrionales bacterium]|nr:M48 family metallopeptidase [Bdellovibrionales bacterium]